MLVTMEDVVLASTVKFLFADAGLVCLDLFQSMLMKIMFAPAVLCSSAPVPCSVAVQAVLCSSSPVPCSVAANDVEADHADDIVLLVEYLVKRKLKHGSSNCLSRSLHERTLQ